MGNSGWQNNSASRPVRIDSPAENEMEGVVDLREENLDMQWHVTVPVTRENPTFTASGGWITGLRPPMCLIKCWFRN